MKNLIVFWYLVFAGMPAFAECDATYDMMKAKYSNPEEHLLSLGKTKVPPDQFFVAQNLYEVVSKCGFLTEVQQVFAKTKFKEWQTEYYVKKAELIATSGGDLDRYVINKNENQTIIDYIKKYGAEANRDVSSDIQRIRNLSKQNENKYKNSCSDVDNRKTECGKILGTTRNQKDLDWCFAYTTADLYSCKIGRRVSATDVAFQVHAGHLNEPDVFSRGTSTIAAIDKMRQVGVCLEADQPSDLAAMSLLETYQKILQQNERFRKVGARAINCAILGKAFPRINVLDFGKIVESTDKNLLEELNALACKKRYVVGADEAKQVAKKDPADFLKNMNQLIDSQKPFHISYEQALLYDGPIIQKQNQETAYNHSSIIMGRRFNKEKNVCEYLIRNSYGPEHSEAMNIDHTQEEGHQWVNVEFLLERANYISYFK